MYLLSDLSAVRPNSFPRDSITFIIMRHQYTSICSQILSTAQTDFRSPHEFPHPRYHPTRSLNHILPILEKSKIRLLSAVARNDAAIRRHVIRESFVSGKLTATSKVWMHFSMNAIAQSILHKRETWTMKTGKASYKNRQGTTIQMEQRIWRKIRDAQIY